MIIDRRAVAINQEKPIRKMPPCGSPLPQKRVALNSRACSLVPVTGVVASFKRKVTLRLERELPHRLRRSSLLGRSLLQDDLLYIAALIDLWLLHSYKTPPTLVGGALRAAVRAVKRSDAFGITSKDLARCTIFVGGHSVHPSAPSREVMPSA